jgi:hypothetical protein
LLNRKKTEGEKQFRIGIITTQMYLLFRTQGRRMFSW